MDGIRIQPKATRLEGNPRLVKRKLSSPKPLTFPFRDRVPARAYLVTRSMISAPRASARRS